MQRLVMFNGPPRAGKDTAGQICQDVLGKDMTLTKFTTEVKNYAHASLGLECEFDHFEDLKDTPLPEFKGMTPREYYIETSRQLRSVDVEAVSKLLIQKLPEIDTKFVINTDVGMDYEARALVDYYGAENCLLVRIKRDGKTFENDNRNWVSVPEDCPVVDIQNTTKENFLSELKEIIEEFSMESLPELAI